MTPSQPARPTSRRIRIRWIRVAGLLVVIGAIAASLGSRLPASSSTAASPIDVRRSEHRGALGGADGAVRDGARVSEHRGALGEADGVVPDGVTVFDDEVPAVANLDPDQLGALRRAATDAAGDGIELYVTSGWRSPEYQNHLLREAISEYGSEEEAARWVATADTSPHVSGDAIDIGPSDATAWLSEHGAEYGLCQIYSNEPWHYELRPEAIDRGCPPMYADPTHDPRMRGRSGTLAHASEAPFERRLNRPRMTLGRAGRPGCCSDRPRGPRRRDRHPRRTQDRRRRGGHPPVTRVLAAGPSNRLAPLTSAVHAFDVSAALTYVKDGTILPHHQQ